MMKIGMKKNQNSMENLDKAEISDVRNDTTSNSVEQSEITDKSGKNEAAMENIPNITENNKSGKGKSGKNKGKRGTSKSRVDAYMKQRSINRQMQQSNEDETGKQSEISDSNRHMLTRSQRQLETDENKGKGDETKIASEKEDEEDEEYFSCKICSQTFKNHIMFKKHKVSCMKIKKKHCCSKCGNRFS